MAAKMKKLSKAEYIALPDSDKVEVVKHDANRHDMNDILSSLMPHSRMDDLTDTQAIELGTVAYQFNTKLKIAI